jgi:ABC-type glycerol-3-phosphate transport system substrate-binding protein
MRTRRLALVGLAAFGVAACGGSEEQSEPATTAPKGPVVVAKIPTGELSQPCAEVEGFGSLWVTNYGSDELVPHRPGT